MKRPYISPNVFIVKVETTSMMAQSVTSVRNQTSTADQLVKGDRGSWSSSSSVWDDDWSAQ